MDLLQYTSLLQEVREALPVTAQRVYLNTGTFGPLPSVSAQAIAERARIEMSEGRLPPTFLEREAIYQEARTRIARLLHSDATEIALTHSTSEGLNIVCYGFDWQEGDEVITTNHEHNSALAPLYQLRKRRSIAIRVADLGLKGDRPLAAAIKPLISSRTKLIVVSHISFKTGAVLDIPELTSLAQRIQIPVLVDGAQSAGVLPLDLQTLGIDFYAIPMQKWLCGPEGTGALYVRHSQQTQPLSATYVRFFSLKEDKEVWQYTSEARRLEWGGRQTAALAGQVASLRWLEEEVGYAWIYRRIAALHTYAWHTLQQFPNLRFLTPQPGCSGLLTFRLLGLDPEMVATTLRSTYNIHLRTIKDWQALRISIGFFNTEDEIDALAAALTSIIKSRRNEVMP